MLFINDKKLSGPEFSKEIERITGKKIDVDSLKKNAAFKFNEVNNTFNLNKLVRFNLRVPNINQGSDVMSVFRYYSVELEEEFEVRYASRTPHKDFQNGGNMVYTPKYIDIPSGDFGFQEKEFDQALFLFVHPHCLDSPFRKSHDEYGNKIDAPYRYSHINISKQSQQKSKRANVLQDCLVHADGIDEDQLKVFAKGLGITYDKTLTSEELRGEIKVWAIDNTQKYSEAMQSESVQFLGLIQDLIDEGVVEVRKIGGLSVWVYGKGENKDTQIVSVPAEVNNAIDYLKTYLGNNMDLHYETIINANRKNYSGKNMEKFLKEKKNGIDAAEFAYTDDSPMTLDDVKDWNSAKLFLKLSHPEGKNPQQKNVGPFLKVVSEGVVTNENLSEEIHNYMGK